MNLRINRLKLNGYKYSIFLFGFIPLLPEKIKGLPVIVFFIYSIFSYINSNNKSFDIKEFLINSSLYTIGLFSIVYTGSFYLPLNKMETMLSLLIVPLSFNLIKRIKHNPNLLKNFLTIFLCSTTILSIICLCFYAYNDLFLEENFKVNSFRKLVTEIPFFNDHPIYVSIYLGLSLLFIMKIYQAFSWNNYLLLISALINIFHLLLLSSKGVIIALIIAFIIFGILILRKSYYKFFYLILVISFFISSIVYFPNIERRFRELGIKTTYTELHINNSTSIRIAIYKCALIQVINNPIIGFGWGKGELMLKKCYEDKSEYMYNKAFNTHNQFLAYYLDCGILGLLILLGFLFRHFKIALRNKNRFQYVIICYFTIILLTENILNRQSGLILFIFFTLFLYFDNKSKTMICKI